MGKPVVMVWNYSPTAQLILGVSCIDEAESHTKASVAFRGRALFQAQELSAVPCHHHCHYLSVVS